MASHLLPKSSSLLVAAAPKPRRKERGERGESQTKQGGHAAHDRG